MGEVCYGCNREREHLTEAGYGKLKFCYKCVKRLKFENVRAEAQIAIRRAMYDSAAKEAKK